MAGLHTLKRMTKRPYRRVGRGQSSTRGKQSGRGGKGQTARSGNKRRPELRDIIKKIPKRRGYGKNRGRTVWENKPRPVSISLARLEKHFESGGEITRAMLAEKGVIRGRKGKMPMVKIVGADTSKKFVLKGVTASQGAKSAVEKAGGSIA